MRHGGLGLLNPFALLEQAGLDRGWFVADLGCGSLGHFVFPAAHLVGATGRVYAVDVQKHAFQRLERDVREHQCWHVCPLWADIEADSLTIPESSIDLTLMINTLYLAQARDRWAQEASRVTKSQGRLLVIDWHPEAAPLGPAANLRLSPTSVRELFEGHGWKVEKDLQASDHHYGYLLRHTKSEPEARIEFVSHSF